MTTTTPAERAAIQNRYDFMYFFDVTDGNPNGDPDAGNLPRIDPETGHGLVTDVCLKRKIRNYVGLVKEEQPPYEIYVKERAVLNNQHDRAYTALKIKPAKQKPAKKEEDARALTRWMCDNFFDIRTFGAVMSTDVNCGQVRGPVQFTFARTITPIVSTEFAVTRCAVTTEREAKDQQGGNRTMGRKFAVPYGLYRAHGFINPNLALGEHGTGFSEDDLELFKTALNLMFENDHSAARGMMKPVGCVAFKHDCKFGNARADQLFARVRCEIRSDLRTSDSGDLTCPPRSFGDYELTLDDADLPDGITAEIWIPWN